MDPLLPFLTEPEIEEILKNFPVLKNFWKNSGSIIIVRRPPSPSNPLYEIQLLLDFGQRLESYGWVWIDALEGKILNWVRDP